MGGANDGENKISLCHSSLTGDDALPPSVECVGKILKIQIQVSVNIMFFY